MTHIIGGPFSKVSFEQYDLDSPDQLKEFLFSIGWKPDSWNYNKETKERTSPKITESSLTSIGENELGKWIAWYYTLRHRRNFIENATDPENKGLLSYLRDDGRVESEAITCGTPTARYRHRKILNVPKADGKVLYGRELRSLFICKSPYVMVGSDLSGVEARLLGHFTSLFDGGEMARELLTGDIHTKTAEAMGIDRNTAKTMRYAIMYGSGIGKLASILNCSTKEAEKHLATFYDASPGLKKLNDYLLAFYNKHKYIRAIDKRHLFIRSKHILLNSLIQGSAAVIFKHWGCNIWREIDKRRIDGVVIIGYHDEWVCRVHEDHVEIFSQLLKETLQEVKEMFNLNVDLDTSTKTGQSWAQVH